MYKINCCNPENVNSLRRENRKLPYTLSDV